MFCQNIFNQLIINNSFALCCQLFKNRKENKFSSKSTRVSRGVITVHLFSIFTDSMIANNKQCFSQSKLLNRTYVHQIFLQNLQFKKIIPIISLLLVARWLEPRSASSPGSESAITWSLKNIHFRENSFISHLGKCSETIG